MTHYLVVRISWGLTAVAGRTLGEAEVPWAALVAGAAGEALEAGTLARGVAYAGGGPGLVAAARLRED